MRSTFGYVGSTLACIAFVSILVNIWSTFGYFGSTLGYVGSTLEYIESTLRHSGSTLGVSRHNKYYFINNFCLEKVKMAIRTKTSEWLKLPKTAKIA